MTDPCTSTHQTVSDGMVVCAATEAHAAHCSVWPPQGLGYIWWDEQSVPLTTAQDEE